MILPFRWRISSPVFENPATKLTLAPAARTKGVAATTCALAGPVDVPPTPAARARRVPVRPAGVRVARVVVDRRDPEAPRRRGVGEDRPARVAADRGREGRVVERRRAGPLPLRPLRDLLEYPVEVRAERRAPARAPRDERERREAVGERCRAVLNSDLRRDRDRAEVGGARPVAPRDRELRRDAATAACRRRRAPGTGRGARPRRVSSWSLSFSQGGRC